MKLILYQLSIYHCYLEVSQLDPNKYSASHENPKLIKKIIISNLTLYGIVLLGLLSSYAILLDGTLNWIRKFLGKGYEL